MKKFIIASLSVLILIAGLTAYKVVNNSAEKQKVVVSEPPKTQPATAAADTTKNNENINKEEEKPKETTASGVYVGQIDGNSIEVKVDGNPIALYFSDEVKESFNSKAYKEGSKVEITYYKNDKGQTILTNIKIK